MFFHSETQLIQFTDWQIGEKSSLSNLQTRYKKRKKYRRKRNEFSKNDNIKFLKYKSCLIFRACQIKIYVYILNLLTQLIQFTLQFTIYKQI